MKDRYYPSLSVRWYRLLYILALAAILVSIISSNALGAAPVQDPTITGADRLLFQPQRVDAPRMFLDMTDRSMRLDSTSNHYPHVAYGGDHLYYASYDAAGWHTELVDPADGVGRYASLALDSSNNPHISYYDAILGALKYATKTGATWTIKTIDQGPSDVSIAPPALNLDATLSTDFKAPDRNWLPNPAAEPVVGESEPVTLFTPEMTTFTPEEVVVNPQPETPSTSAPTEVTSNDETGRGLYTSIVVDGFQHPSISYYDSWSGDLKYAHYDGALWRIYTLDSGGNVGKYSSMALDTAGNPHISYYDGTNGDLKYARYDGSSWSLSRIDFSTNDVGQYSSIIVDSANRVYISYYDNTRFDVKFAQWSGSSWSFQTINSPDDIGQGSSVGLTNANPPKPVISYYNLSKGRLDNARWNGSAWEIYPVAGSAGGSFTSISTINGDTRISFYDAGYHQLRYAIWDNNWILQSIDTSVDLGLYASMALDSGDKPHIAYLDDTNDRLKLARWTGAAWDIQYVVPDHSAGLYSVLALDPAGKEVIGYYDDAAGKIRVSRWTGSAWDTKDVEFALPLKILGLALDTAGNPRLAYYDQLTNRLKVAIWNGSSYVIKIIDDTNVGQYPSIAIGSDNNIHVSYYDPGHKYLRYAKVSPDGSAWAATTVDSNEAGNFSSITVDAANNPRIAYFWDYQDKLRYATYNGSGWSTELVDDKSYTTGWYPSLKLDAAGNPHITYLNNSCLCLLYSHKSGGYWHAQTVDNRGTLGRYSSIGITSTGAPVVAYYDYTNGDLKYASPIIARILYLPLTRR